MISQGLPELLGFLAVALKTLYQVVDELLQDMPERTSRKISFDGNRFEEIYDWFFMWLNNNLIEIYAYEA